MYLDMYAYMIQVDYLSLRMVYSCTPSVIIPPWRTAQKHPRGETQFIIKSKTSKIEDTLPRIVLTTLVR